MIEKKKLRRFLTSVNFIPKREYSNGSCTTPSVTKERINAVIA
jgi:hypothetical protein